MTGKNGGRRGRPLGFRLSEASKRAISLSKTGQKHRQETRDKISRSLSVYFRRRNLLSNEIVNRYCRIDDDNLCGWIYGVQDTLDSYCDVMSTKVLNNKTKVEITCGTNIERLNHSLTPEFMLLLKEEIQALDCDDTEDRIKIILECVL